MSVIKGQTNSKWFFTSWCFLQKTNEQIPLYYLSTCFRSFIGMKTPKIDFEINWLKSVIQTFYMRDNWRWYHHFSLQKLQFFVVFLCLNYAGILWTTYKVWMKSNNHYGLKTNHVDKSRHGFFKKSIGWSRTLALRSCGP